MNRERAHLVLADGTSFEGQLWGHPGPARGEVVFTTGMTGYQEVLTDPSFTGQMVTMTAPQIGNTGVNPEDPESVSGAPCASGFIVRDLSPVVSNYRSTSDLDSYLKAHGVTGISGVDTRRLTRILRDGGSQNGAIGAGSIDTLVEHARSAPNMNGLDLVSKVTPKEPYQFTETRGEWRASFNPAKAMNGRTDYHPDPRFKVVAMDFGVKRNILRTLVDVGCDVTGVPASMSATEILKLKPEGIFLSSGPGDPAAVSYAEQTIRELLGQVPIFGICLGHQLLARALGGKTYKLKFGHRGLNQPVKDLKTNRVEVTTQNHGFVVDVDSLKGIAETSHIHLNDGTSEGLVATDAQAFSVQYHPEAAAGPHDALYLFRRFTKMMRDKR